MTGFFTSPRVAWGPGAIEQLSGLGARRAFVLVDATVAAQQGHRRVVEELAKSETVTQVDEAGADANRTDQVAALGRRLSDFRPDWVVAVGGGRTIDSAKAARLLLEKPDLSLSSLTPILEVPDTLSCRLAAVPTTSGSGSEASWTVDLRLPGEDRPVELAHRALVPDWALVDARFAETLPHEPRRDGAMEALGQAVEAYLSAWANPFSDALALSVVRTVFERLPHALKWSDDPDAKEAVHYAATLAGLAASNAQRGVAHALARALTGPTGLPYGQLVGILLPRVLEYDRPSARDRLETLALTVRAEEDRATAPFEVRLARLFDAVRMPATLSGAGVERPTIDGALNRIVEDALRSPAVLANPRVPGRREIEALLVDPPARSGASP